MSTYVLVHGAGGSSWDWHLVEAELRQRGHEVIAPDLPCDDDAAGLPEYADAVVEAVGDRAGVVLVAHSLAGFTAPLVCDRIPVEMLVLVAGMIPSPGEAPGEWWDNTGHAEAQRQQAERDGRPVDEDMAETFLHDVPPDLAAEALERSRDQSGTPFEAPWPMPAWPTVPTRVLLCQDDRMFPPPFMRRIADERLGIEPDEMPGGHYVAISRPKELADRLEGYVSAEPGGFGPRA